MIARLAGITTALAAIFGIGALAGGVFHPSAPGGDAKVAMRHGAEAMAMSVRGLAVADDGLRIVVANPQLRLDRTEQLRFRIVDDEGRTVRDFDIEHTKRMHLIVARRDLTGFQHLHPTMAADGTWSAPLRLAEAGSYRVFADFSHDDKPVTLADDLRVDGAANLKALPLPTTTAVSNGGYEVRRDAGALHAGGQSELRFTVTKDGLPVRTEPYLGAGGHLVALRDGDLAFLHVHPNENDDRIGFEATFPTAGAYRLFLQFKVNGAVQTVAFTEEVR